ncbi:MAG: bifunctional folylpolyglutamate synthase/dihydrofolate synthase [Bacteroidetes bacterium]|nr:bifunctional folylpolyglutamate synthase/dihydrofolate synthase [Bacteroidota bacterium]MCB9044077.1 bifunctional folylpolyglutamate synthase/dihydrofolate synthase [Chitinophagales bacterium]
MPNYSKTLDFLFEQLPMYQRIGEKALKKDLHNIRQMCMLLGNPQTQFRSVHIAGTNGKGSVSHALAAMLQAQGYKTGLYISPHYIDFRERIKINGKFIPKTRVTAFVEHNKNAFRAIDASFFEWSVAMAFWYFAEEKVDFAVVETGLGGRLDSTNILQAILSVITHISYDHTATLGNTLQAIAAEKAGIIKAQTPVLIGRHQAETDAVFAQTSAANKANCYWAEDMLHVKKSFLHKNYQQIEFTNSSAQEISIKTDLTATYQIENIRTALAAAFLLQKNISLSEKAMINGLRHIGKSTKFWGRWQIIAQNPLCIVDSAHNEGGIRAMLHEIAQINYRQLHFVLGFVKDKEIQEILSFFPKNAHYYFCNAQIPRALFATQLQASAKEFGLEGNAYESVVAALSDAQKVAKNEDLIVVCGSIFVAGEVLASIYA